MPSSSMGEVIHFLRSALLPDGTDLTDGQLLEAFVRRRESAALEGLVQRHGPMVWGVCRRILQNHHDAEDAFQATFLVLVRKAASIRSQAKVGSWLYGVAHQTALKARATRARRLVRERPVTEMTEPAMTEPDLWSDLQPLLDREVSGLPEKYRTVILLCDLEGKTGREAARQLGCPEGTIGSRLARGRALLAKRLGQHGIALSGGALAGVLSEKAASASVPASVLAATIKAVTLVAAGQAASSLISAQVAALAEGVMKAMLVRKLKIASVVLVVVATGLLGAGLLSRGSAEEKRGDEEEGQWPEVLVRHPKPMEFVPTERLTGRLVYRQGDSITVSFAVDEHTYLRYQRLLRQHKVKGAGSTLSFGLADENGYPHEGKLKGFASYISPKTGTVEAYAALPDPDRLLLTGMFVRVRMPFGPPQKGLGVPAEAVLTDQGKHYLLVVTDKNIVERRRVALGPTEGNLRVIEKGVSADEWIVVSGHGALQAGIRVKPRIVGDAAKEPKGARDRVGNKLWAGMTVNRPLFRAGQDTNLLQLSFALINESDKTLDPRIPGYPRLIVNGKELDLSSLPASGPRDERFKALPAGDNLQFGMGAGRFFDKPGVYKVYWQGEGFRSNEVVFRVVK
jgi:RNA polymerase sigma factor (sigma-70 family)